MAFVMYSARKDSTPLLPNLAQTWKSSNSSAQNDWDHNWPGIWRLTL